MSTKSTRVESTLQFRPGRAADLPFVREKSSAWRLVVETPEPSSFLIAEDASGRIVGFGRVKKYEACYELGTVGVEPEWRGKGLGAEIVRRLIASFPSDEIWITTDLIGYFEKLGFRVVEDGPKELQEKIASTCRVKGRTGVRLMSVRREPSR